MIFDEDAYRMTVISTPSDRSWKKVLITTTIADLPNTYASTRRDSPQATSYTPFACYSFNLSFPATILLVDLTRPIVRAPEFPQAPWVNTLEPITMTGLRGRVVMVDIWDFT